MTWNDRIAVDPDVLVGKPVIKGTRIAVEVVIDLMAQGWTAEQILDEYDHLTTEDIRACLAYVGELLKGERVYPMAPAVRRADAGQCESADLGATVVDLGNRSGR